MRYFSNSATAAFIHSADLRTKGRIMSPAPNLSPTSFIAGSKVSFKVFTAASCNSSLDKRAITSSLLNDDDDGDEENDDDDDDVVDSFKEDSSTFFVSLPLTLSKIAPTTSYSIPSRSLFTIL